jgi:excisionase family DNA binding protein
LEQLERLIGALIGVSEAANMLKVSESMIRYWFDNARLPGMRLRGERVFHPDDVKAFGLALQVDRILSGKRKRGPKPSMVRAKLELVGNYEQAIA